MYELVVSKRFKRNLKQFLNKHPELELVIEKRIDTLQQDPFDSQLKTHTLTGKMRGVLALSVTYEYRLTFTINNQEIWLLAIGTHDEVY